MNKKYFLILIALAAISVYIVSNMNALAANYELSVPIPGETTKIIENPPQYILMIFRFSLALAGLLALGIIIFGAIQYTTSAGNVARQQDAKDRITSAIYGIILLVGATLILTTINPDLALLKWEKPAPIPKLLSESIKWGDIWRGQLEDLSKRAGRAWEEVEKLKKEREQALAAGDQIKAQELLIEKLEQTRIAVLATTNRLRGEISGEINKVVWKADSIETPTKQIITQRLQDWSRGTIKGILFGTVSGRNQIIMGIENTDYYVDLEKELRNTLVGQQNLVVTYWNDELKKIEDQISAEKQVLNDLRAVKQQSSNQQSNPPQQQIKEF